MYWQTSLWEHEQIMQTPPPQSPVQVISAPLPQPCEFKRKGRTGYCFPKRWLLEMKAAHQVESAAVIIGSTISTEIWGLPCQRDPEQRDRSRLGYNRFLLKTDRDPCASWHIDFSLYRWNIAVHCLSGCIMCVKHIGWILKTVIIVFCYSADTARVHTTGGQCALLPSPQIMAHIHTDSVSLVGTPSSN